MQRNSVFANDNTKASVNERASMLSEHRLKFIDNAHQTLIANLNLTKETMITCLNNNDHDAFSTEYDVLHATLTRYHSNTLSSQMSMHLCDILRGLHEYGLRKDFKSLIGNHEFNISGYMTWITEQAALNTVEAKEKIIRDSLAAASESQHACRIL